MSHGKLAVAFVIVCVLSVTAFMVARGSGDAGIPNPASAYCEQHGGKLEIHKDAAGNESGTCVFADGSSCDEWAYYRGECRPGGQKPVPQPTAGMANPASVFCEQNGGKLDIRQDASGGQVGMCVFSDGSTCEEWAYFRGECQPGAQ